MRLFLIGIGVTFCISLLAQQTVIATVQSHYLFRGIENRIDFGNWNLTTDSIDITAPHATLFRRTSNSWFITPDTAYIEQPMYIRYFLKGKQVETDTITYQLLWIPDPKVYFGSARGTDDSIIKSLASSVWGLYPRCENFPMDLHYHIVSFELLITGKAGSRKIISQVATFSLEIEKAIASAESGSRLSFENIVVRYPDGRIRKVDPVSVILK